MIPHKSRKIISLFTSIVTIALLSGCSQNIQQSVAQASSQDSFTVVTSFYPIYISTLNVMKDVPNAEVINMTEPITGCLHDYALTTKDLKTLETAEAFVINGAGMESFLDKITVQMPDLTIIEASKDITLITNETLDEAGEANPHVWVSITNTIKQVENIQAQLSKLDAAHSELYEKNAKAYIEKLEAQKTKMHAILDTLPHKDIVTFHEAFPYFAEEFNLNIAGVVEREPGSAPNAMELAATIDQVKSLGIKALFIEPQYPAKAAETIATETGATVYVLDPAVTGKMEAQAYIDIMENNLKVLAEALK